MKRNNKTGLWNGVKRIARYRLHVPMMRSKGSATHVARGVSVGMAWAMSPFFGLHMMFVFVTWFISRKIFKWDFCLINGLAWTWTTNVLTVIPAYYLCYLTGQILLGNLGDPLGYDTFKSIFITAEERATDDPGTLWSQLQHLWSAFGLPLFAGSAVWMMISGWVSYKLAHAFMLRYREVREGRMAEARKKKARPRHRQPTGRLKTSE